MRLVSIEKKIVCDAIEKCVHRTRIYTIFVRGETLVITIMTNNSGYAIYTHMLIRIYHNFNHHSAVAQCE